MAPALNQYIKIFFYFYIFIVGAICCSANATPIPKNGDVYVKLLREEIILITPPNKDVVITGSSSGSKRESAYVETTYTSKMDKDEILAYYKQNLIKNGWWYSHSLFNNDSIWIESYCKDGLKANIQFNQNNQENQQGYTLSMSWSQVSAKHCKDNK